ncbi:uncharacterized protein LOC143278028 [Babylonia areolata]|uniref:uncharacterized protein LOC143278028 n=1 Tax=Babylonia areolata TaxID=304850 RepID=UPI003FD4E26A
MCDTCVCAVLCCAVLDCAVSCCVVLCCAVLRCTSHEEHIPLTIHLIQTEEGVESTGLCGSHWFLILTSLTSWTQTDGQPVARYRVGGFELSHLVVLFILLGLALFILYWLWEYPCTAQGPGLTSPACTSGRVISRPEAERPGEMVLYATEIEPGTVVLQTPSGDLFRVLREYDAVTNSGSPTSGLPPATSFPVHYIPAYTRAHVQNQASAPPYPGVEEGEAVTSPCSEPWRPLSVHSASQY